MGPLPCELRQGGSDAIWPAGHVVRKGVPCLRRIVIVVAAAVAAAAVAVDPVQNIMNISLINVWSVTLQALVRATTGQQFAFAKVFGALAWYPFWGQYQSLKNDLFFLGEVSTHLGDPDWSNRRGRQAEGDKQLTGQAEGDEQLSADDKDNCADQKNPKILV